MAEMVRCGRLVPRLDSEFWKVYGNKLRVFGTETQVMHLGRDTEAMDETLEAQDTVGTGERRVIQ